MTGRRISQLLRLAGSSLLLLTAARALTVGPLRVESRDRPLGLDVAQPHLAWLLESNERAERQSAYQILVATSPEALAADRGDVWDSGRVASGETFAIAYAGPALARDTRYFWKVRVWDASGRPSPWSEPSWWQTGLLAPSDWHAQWIGASAATATSPLLRRDFSLAKPVARATAYAYASGWYRLLFNGTELTERVLSPINSNYPKGLFYDAYDVTALLHPGANTAGLWLGGGYNQGYSKYGYRWDAPVAGLVQLEILFADGTRTTLGTDERWRWTASPVTANDIYNGETYDARRDTPGWAAPGFDDRTWQPVAARPAPAGPLLAAPFPGLAVVAELTPQKITEPQPGVFIFDFGQNLAGWTRLHVRGPAGATVTLRHAEELHADGTLDVTTNRAARATDVYTLAGRDAETYEPRFTYHGFRYVEVTGLPNRPDPSTLTARAIRAAVAEAGTFTSSDPLLNRLHSNFRWSLANNLVGIPTDTATRDERTPCQMDSLAVEEAAIANWDLQNYYAKWLHDIAGDGGTLPNWTGDQVVLPYLLYQHYGDRRILERHYANSKQVVETFAANAAPSRHWAEGYGDWAAPNPAGSFEGSFSEGDLVATAFWYRCARIVAETAQLLGQPDDAGKFTALAERIRAEFHERLYHPATATYGSGRQVTSILPLAFDLVAPADRASVAAALRHRIETADRGHLDTGIFGTRYLFEVLIDHGAAPLAWRVLNAPGYPGYVDQIAQGATTTWEQWNYAGSMQTHDHAMFAGPDATFYSHYAGIRPAAPGYREILIRPEPPPGVARVAATRATPVGEIASTWEQAEGVFQLTVTIPANTTATVVLPVADAAQVLESGRPAATAAGVQGVTLQDGRVTICLGSGRYVFTAPRPSS